MSMIQTIELETRKNLTQKTEEIKKEVKAFFENLFYTHYTKVKQFQPKIQFTLDKGDFLVKTAENFDEVLQALRLRHEVFYGELLHQKKIKKLDIDRFDSICDHLTVIEKKSGAMIGTYRFNSSAFSDEFYSSTEFDIANIIKLKGNKLELGRACIHKDYRNGLTISLLWAGIAEYLKASESKYLFGCSSVKTTDFYQIANVYKYLKESSYAPEELQVFPLKKFKVNGLASYAEFLGKISASYDPKVARKMVPSLLKTYIRAGAVVCGEPALDKDFQCIDLLTLMDITKMEKSFSRKFEVC